MTEWIDVKKYLPSLDGLYLTQVIDNAADWHEIIQMFYITPMVKNSYSGCANYETHWENQTWDDNIVVKWAKLPERLND